MQAAGRLRQLGPGRQTLRVVGTPDVTDKIRAANMLSSAGGSKDCDSYAAGKRKSSGKGLWGGTSKQGSSASGGGPAGAAADGVGAAVHMQHVLQWVMANTVEANQHGVVQWAGHGLHFAVTQDAPDRAWVDEMLKLEDFYGSSKGEKPVSAVVAAMVKQQLRRCKSGKGRSSQASRSSSSGDGMGQKQLGMVREVEQRSVKYGEGHSVRAGQGADEECERELEKEEEEEEEMEVQVARAKARQEVDWQYGAALTAASAAELRGNAVGLQLLCLPDVAKQMLEPKCLGEIPWAARVYATKGFLYAIEQLPGSRDGCINEYLRLVVEVLVLPNKEVVLVSEREAEGLLEQWLAQKGIDSGGSSSMGSGIRARGSATSTPYLVSLGYAWAAAGRGPLATALAPAAAAAYYSKQQQRRQQQELVEVPELVSVQLFNGGASFASSEQREWLKGMMRGRREAAEALVSMRGTLPMFPRSDLEKACDVRVG